MASGLLLHQAIDGSFLCSDYELRVTRRCCEQDLGCPQLDPFVNRASHEIIRAFINRRRDSPDNTRQVAPLTTGRTVYRLAYGERHRGATWHDEAHGVVWLLAYAVHEFKGEGDAFPYFKELDARDRLLPTSEDYEDLFRARAARLAQAVPAECTDLLSSAREALGTEICGVVANHIRVSCSVAAIDSLEEITVAVNYDGLTPESLAIILPSFFPDASAMSLEQADGIAERQINPAVEIAYRAITETD